MKRKGATFERELIDELWKHGFAAVRVAGSGAMSYPLPDVVASNGRRTVAFEVKMRRKLPLYISGERIENLLKFAEIFGAEAFIAVRIARQGWKFFRASEFGKGNIKIDEELFESGLELGEVLGIFTQRRLADAL